MNWFPPACMARRLLKGGYWSRQVAVGGAAPVHLPCRTDRRSGWRAGLLLILSTGSALFAETLFQANRLWQTDDGLPQNNVRAIAQTADGYLWVGTDEGVVRFDGLRFVPLNSAEFPQLATARITALAGDAGGALWIGTEGDGLFQSAAGSVQHFGKTHGLRSETVRALLIAPADVVWVATDAGVAKGKFGRAGAVEWEFFPTPPARALAHDAAGRFWVGTTSGLLEFDPAANSVQVSPARGPFTNAIRALHVDASNRLWVATAEGLWVENANPRRPWDRIGGLPSPVITALAESATSGVWVGSFGGLTRLRDGRPRAWQSPGKIFDDPVGALFGDREGNLWVGAKSGLHRLGTTRFQNFTTDSGLPGNNAVAVCEDAAGAVWAAIWGSGLVRMQDGQLLTVSATNGLTHDSVLALHPGRDGYLWVGFDFGGGLNRLGRTFTNSYPRTTNVINTAVRVIHQDRENALWVGTSRGLFRLAGDAVTSFTTNNGLAGSTVMDICETRTGALWIGTRNGGLNRFRAGEFTAFTTADGMFSDEVFDIAEDDYGCLWLTCRRGLFRVAKSDLAAVDRAGRKPLNGSVFGREDGLNTVQFNGVAKPSAWKARDGRLWFPTIRGIVAVDASVPLNTQPPLVAIEEVFAKRQLLQPALATSAPPARVTIQPGTREVEIHYTALSFRAPEKNRFRHQLEGFDSGWVEAGRRRVANYYSLHPGSFRFRVQAANDDGVWGETEALLEVVVLPHFWETWVFKVLVALAGIALLVAFYRARLARLRAIENLRIRIASDLHDDVGSRLTKVAMVTEFVEHETRPDDPQRPHVESISRTVREITRAMDEIVWTINPRNDALDNLASYAYQYAEEYFRGTSVRCRLDFPVVTLAYSMNTEARHNFFMAYKESLSNVLKHAQAREVRVTFTVAANQIKLVVTDNGVGMDLEHRKGGDGLGNLRERLRRIGGQATIESQPGQGTTVTLSAPVRRT